MARKDGNFLRGVLGDFVYRVVRGKQIVSKRVVPGTMKYTKNSIKRAQTFGMASNLSGQIKECFFEVLQGFHDYSFNNRMNTLISRVLNKALIEETNHYSFDEDTFASLDGINFNLEAKTEVLLGKGPIVLLEDGNLKVSIPALTIPTHFKFPANSFRCELKVSLALFRLKDGYRSRKLNSKSIDMLKNVKNFKGYTFEFGVPDGCLCLVGLSLKYFVANGDEWRSINNKNFNPVSICSVLLTAGNYVGGNKKEWVEMLKFG